jgi:hypothetical protein
MEKVYGRLVRARRKGMLAPTLVRMLILVQVWHRRLATSTLILWKEFGRSQVWRRRGQSPSDGNLWFVPLRRLWY